MQVILSRFHHVIQAHCKPQTHEEIECVVAPRSRSALHKARLQNFNHFFDYYSVGARHGSQQSARYNHARTRARGALAHTHTHTPCSTGKQRTRLDNLHILGVVGQNAVEHCNKVGFPFQVQAEKRGGR